MSRMLTNLITVLKTRIYHASSNFYLDKNKDQLLLDHLQHIQTRITYTSKLREEHFLYRNNIEHYDRLLEHLQTLQSSIYKQHNAYCRICKEHQSKLLALINRRKIIEKIRNNKYSNIKR
ncbi:hypothetical protein [Chlamydia ibidis]|uniref:hypothetical protein n=1 Tax=Chlamydia ibidis TaxID=1405396 RepID=UPI0003FB849C|nr:hypothetical protein [Chlamydia ibidis]